jgi:hypothetical protein
MDMSREWLLFNRRWKFDKRGFMTIETIWKFRAWLYALIIGFLIIIGIYKYNDQPTREDKFIEQFKSINAQFWPPDMVPHPNLPEPNYPPPGSPTGPEDYV